MWTVSDYPRAVWVVHGEICAINDALMCIRPGMTMNFGFHEVKSMLNCGREQ